MEYRIPIRKNLKKVSTKRPTIESSSKRVCDKCGREKDLYGGKTCSKGHFICHSCASGHIHCPLCGHTLR
jgi:hypothetical protein